MRQHVAENGIVSLRNLCASRHLLHRLVCTGTLQVAFHHEFATNALFESFVEIADGNSCSNPGKTARWVACTRAIFCNAVNAEFEWRLAIVICQ
jgi:hypothetical protein